MTPKQTTDSTLQHVQRLRQQLGMLVEDLRAWVELRLKLTQLEIEERIEARMRQLLMRALAGVLAGLAVVFGLVAVALGLGSWLGHPAWGFLGVALFSAGLAAILHALRRRDRAHTTLTPAPEQSDAA